MSAVGIAACLWSMKHLICKGGGKRGRNRRIQIAGDSWKFAFGPPRQASPDDGPPNRGGVSGSPGIRRPAGGRFPLGRDFLSLHPFKKYYTQSSDQEDLISIGTIGLIKGISSFDPSKGARLATYAARCIENAILSQRPAILRVCPNRVLWMKNGSCPATRRSGWENCR